MLNAVLLFFTFYADRMIRGVGAYDWATLALYGVVLQLAADAGADRGPGGGLDRAAAASAGARAWQADTRSGALFSPPMPVWPPHWSLAFTVVAPPAIALVYGDALRPDLALAFADWSCRRVPGPPHAIFAAGGPRRGARAIPPAPTLSGRWRSFRAAIFRGHGSPRLPAIAAAAAAGEAGATLRAWILAGPVVSRPPQKGSFRMSSDPISTMVSRNLCTGCGRLRRRVSGPDSG